MKNWLQTSISYENSMEIMKNYRMQGYDKIFIISIIT